MKDRSARSTHARENRVRIAFNVTPVCSLSSQAHMTVWVWCGARHSAETVAAAVELPADWLDAAQEAAREMSGV
jgi:hypothetical protein